MICQLLWYYDLEISGDPERSFKILDRSPSTGRISYSSTCRGDPSCCTDWNLSPRSQRINTKQITTGGQGIMKRLYLSSTDKKLAGICGGIAEYYDIDPTIVRLVTVILGLITGIVPFCLAYVIAWIIVPHKP
jgi:phage shock protein C